MAQASESRRSARVPFCPKVESSAHVRKMTWKALVMLTLCTLLSANGHQHTCKQDNMESIGEADLADIRLLHLLHEGHPAGDPPCLV